MDEIAHRSRVMSHAFGLAKPPHKDAAGPWGTTLVRVFVRAGTLGLVIAIALSRGGRVRAHPVAIMAMIAWAGLTTADAYLVYRRSAQLCREWKYLETRAIPTTSPSAVLLMRAQMLRLADEGSPPEKDMLATKRHMRDYILAHDLSDADWLK